MSQLTLQIGNLTCPSCMQNITKTLNELEGIMKTKFIFNLNKARVYYNEEMISAEDIFAKIIEMGYEIESH